MKSSSYKLILISVSAALFQTANPLVAQEPTPTPTPTEEQISRKKKLLSKLSFARLWYFAPADAGRITLALKSAGSVDPRVIASHVRPGSIRDYRLMRPGKYELLLLDGNVIPDATGKINVPEKKLIPPLAIDFQPGKFQTLLVTSTNGSFSCQILEDTVPDKPNGITFRVLDFSASKDEVLKLFAGQNASNLWASGNPRPTVKIVPNFSGLGRIELYKNSRSSPYPSNSYELEGAPNSAYSVVLFIDRYSQKSMSVTQDAFVDLDEEEAKSMVGALD